MTSVPFSFIIIIQCIQYSRYCFSIRAGTNDLFSDDSLQCNVAFDYVPQAFEHGDIIIKIILYGVCDVFTPFIRRLFSAVYIVEFPADKGKRSANSLHIIELGIGCDRFLRYLDVKQQMLQYVAVYEPVRFLIIERIFCGILVFAEQYRLVLIYMMAVKPFLGAAYMSVLFGTVCVCEVVVLGRTIFIK